MYEAEVNNRVASIETLPAEIREHFAEFRDQVVARTVLPWGEHCTECVWPACYTTCDLYSPRQDGACRQFVDGAVRIDHREGLNPYLIRINFKQWAKLWTVGNLHLVPLAKAGKQELFNITIGAVGRNLPLPSSIKPRVLQKIRYLRTQAAENAAATDTPDCFLLECYNPDSRCISLTFTVRPGTEKQGPPFLTMINLVPGYTRAKVPFPDIANVIDTTKRFEVEIVPNDADNTTLYFGLMDFVKERPTVTKKMGAAGPASKWKCIVWDLDNTLWDGILVEDGPDKLHLRQSAIDVIKETDRRGILHSIASKNNYDDAMQRLRLAGIDQYFLYPQIGWQPKSQSVAQIAQMLNIGVDAIGFVDDQIFEREEVKTTLPQVAVIDAADLAEISRRPECDVPVTDESRNRRQMYCQQEQRQTALKSYEGDYVGFLRDCHIELGINPLNATNLKRVYELAQRTNQLNFSGNRYGEEELRTIATTKHLETYVIDCKDRFGNYGIIGFAIVDTREPRLLDLMFSCRIQGKRVEHAVFCFLLSRFLDPEHPDFYANYRRSSKNAGCGKVFEEMGFECVAEIEGVTSLVFRGSQPVRDDRIVQIKTPSAGEEIQQATPETATVSTSNY